MATSWTDDPAAFTTPDWAALADQDPEGTFFHSPRFLKLYWEEFGAAGLRVAFVRHGGETVAAAAFDVRDGVLSWLGGFDLTDYMGPVGLPAAREPAAKELLAALAERDDWGRADLAGLVKRGGWLPALHAAALESGLVAEVGRDSVAPFLRLPDSYDEYLAGLPGKLRHEIRRKDRRLRAALPDARVVDSTPDGAGPDLDRFVTMHRTAAGAKGRFMVPGTELFFRRLADELLEDGTFRLAFLEAGGEKIAGAIGFRDRGVFRLYNSAYDHARAPVAPGMVLVSELIRATIAEGCRWFDLLKGDLAYKYRFGARPNRVARLLLRRR